MAENEKKGISSIIPVENVQIEDNNLYSQQVELTEEQREKLCKELYNDIDRALEDKDSLVQEIEEYKKAIYLEPDEDEKVSPWDGASNYCDMLTSNQIKILQSSVNNAMLIDPIWIVSTPFEQEYEMYLDDGLNYYANNYMEIQTKLKDVIGLALEEATSFCEVYDVTSTRNLKMKQEYFGIEEFVNAYPSPKSAGLELKEYNQVLEDVADKIDELGSVTIDVEVPTTETKLKLDVYSVDETVIIPFNATDIDTCQGVFFVLKMTNNDLKRYSKEVEGVSFFDPEAVEKTLEFVPERDEPYLRSEENTRNRMNIDTSQYDDTCERNIFKGVYYFELDEEVGPEEFYIYFAWNEKQILRIEKFERIMGERSISVFTPIPVHRMIFGRNIAKDLKPTQELASTLWNMIIDNQAIGNKPFFKADLKEKTNPNSTLSRGGDSLDISPGKIFYLESPSDLTQFPISPMDINTAIKSLTFLYRVSETNTGATSLQSGKESPTDPNAPGNKTAMLINESNKRINEVIGAIRRSLQRLGKHILYKCLSTQPTGWKDFTIKFHQENKEGNNKVLLTPQEVYSKKIVVDVRGQSMEYNLATLSGEIRQLIGLVLSNPALAQNPYGIDVLYTKLLSYYHLRPKEIDKLLLPVKEAIKQLDMQKKMQEMAGTNNMMPPPPPPPGMAGQPQGSEQAPPQEGA